MAASSEDICCQFDHKVDEEKHNCFFYLSRLALHISAIFRTLGRVRYCFKRKMEQTDGEEEDGTVTVAKGVSGACCLIDAMKNLNCCSKSHNEPNAFDARTNLKCLFVCCGGNIEGSSMRDGEFKEEPIDTRETETSDYKHLNLNKTTAI